MKLKSVESNKDCLDLMKEPRVTLFQLEQIAPLFSKSVLHFGGGFG